MRKPSAAYFQLNTKRLYFFHVPLCAVQKNIGSNSVFQNNARFVSDTFSGESVLRSDAERDNSSHLFVELSSDHLLILDIVFSLKSGPCVRRCPTC